MRCDGDGDKHVAGAALPGHALTAQPDLLAVGNAGGNLDFDVLARRQMHALRDPMRCLRQRHRQCGFDVRTDAEILPLEGVTRAAAKTPATSGAAERFPENVLEPARAAGVTATARAGKAFRAEAEGLEFRFRRKTACAAPSARAESLEALETRLALGVDLAAI